MTASLGSRSAYQNEAGGDLSQTERRARPPDRLDEETVRMAGESMFHAALQAVEEL